jgi:hypothetical protein
MQACPVPQIDALEYFQRSHTEWQSLPSSFLAIFADAGGLNVLLLEVKVGFASARVKAVLRVGKQHQG